MKSINTFLLFVVLSLIGCKESITETEQASSFFPLQVGNKWYYKNYTFYSNHFSQDTSTDYRYVSEIKNEITIEDKEYYYLECSFYNGKIYQYNTAYYRTENQKLYILKWDNNLKEYTGGLLADFSKTEGDTFLSYYESKSMKNQPYYFIGHVIERTADVRIIHYEIPMGYDEDVILTFRKNVGIENEYLPDWTAGNLLTKYIIK